MVFKKSIVFYIHKKNKSENKDQFYEYNLQKIVEDKLTEIYQNEKNIDDILIKFKDDYNEISELYP